MESSSTITQQQELIQFRKLDPTTENVEIPALPEGRSITDKKGFLIFGISLLIFLPFFGYTLSKSDIRRWSHGYDECANMCGYNNSKIDGVPCSGKDYTYKPYLESDAQISASEEWDEFLGFIRYSHSQCVHECKSGEKPIGLIGKCELPQKKIKNSETRQNRTIFNFTYSDQNAEISVPRWWKFLLATIRTIALSIFVLILLRYIPGVVIWSVLIIVLIALIILTCSLWQYYFTEPLHSSMRTFLPVCGIISTILTVTAFIIFIILFKKFHLVVELYKEATKATFAMPFLTLVPVVFTLVQIIILGMFFASTTWMFTSRKLYRISAELYHYEMNGIMKFAYFLNVIMVNWALRFVLGIQYLVISGGVAAWYFSKNKQELDSPISTSFFNAVKFHMGTAAFGAFVLTVMDVVRVIMQFFFRSEKVKCIFKCCCNNVEECLQFLSKNAYIETAIHGQSFLRSGKRAAKLLLTNSTSIIAINSVGDFVLGVIVFMLVAISTAISSVLFMDIYDFWLSILVCLFLNGVIIGSIFAVFESITDTLLICFCEDKIINDGLSKPYYMSRDLMKFVENSKKIYGIKDQPTTV